VVACGPNVWTMASIQLSVAAGALLKDLKQLD
jgi:hypothetical protein